MTNDLSNGRRIILVRHASPQKSDRVPRERWPLDDEGRRRCDPLAARLRDHAPGVIITSYETKAAETGQLAAAHLGVPCVQANGLHEQQRDLPLMPEADFLARMRDLFTRPTEAVLGGESAHAARERFAQAIDNALAAHPTGNVVIVAHGTVISLFAAPFLGLKPLSLWERLGLPAMLAFTEYWLPVEMIEEVC